MDARRSRRTNEPENTKLSRSNSTLPGLVLLAVGVICLVLSICLVAAFGFPSNISEKPQKVSGIIALGLGLLLTVIGIGVSVYLKKKKDQRKKEIAKQRRTKISPNVAPPPYDRGPPPSYQDIPKQQTNFNKSYDTDLLSIVSS